jgi:membrane-bound lytic murein transglycosylase F
LLLTALFLRTNGLLPAAAAEKLPPVDSGKWTNKYDDHFRKWSKRYFGPNFDWRWFKSQAIVESGLKPNVKGPTGSRGVMQVQPVTFREIKEDNPHLLNINDPQSNIAAGIYYNRLMFEKWPDRRPLVNRISFMLGSYNVGYGGVLKAVERAEKAGKSGQRWQDVAGYVPKVTRNYVVLITRVMLGGGMTVVEGEGGADGPDRGEDENAQGLPSEARAQHQTSTLSTPAFTSARANSCAVCPVVITSSTTAMWRAPNGPSTRNAPFTFRRRSLADSWVWAAVGRTRWQRPYSMGMRQRRPIGRASSRAWL